MFRKSLSNDHVQNARHLVFTLQSLSTNKFHLPNQINHAGITLLTDSHEIIYPVWEREDKNHTLSSGTTLYRPYLGVYPWGSFSLFFLSRLRGSNKLTCEQVLSESRAETQDAWPRCYCRFFSLIRDIFPCWHGPFQHSNLAPTVTRPITKGRTIRKVMGGEGNFRAAGIFFRYQIPCMNFFQAIA